MELALDEVNAAGGVLGRKLEIVSRDDNGTPGDAVRVAEELMSREKVVMLMGTFASNVGLAVADFAKQRKVPFLASEPLTDKIVWDNGNKYTYRLRASTFMQTAMLVPEAAKLGKKRWAIVYPELRIRPIGHRGVQEADERRGRAAASCSSSRRCRSARSIRARSCRRCSTRSPTRSSRRCSGRISRASSAKASCAACSRTGPVFNLLGGEPEYLDPLKDEAPVGWYVTGYPWYAIDTPEHQKLPQRLPGEVQRLPAPGLGRRLQRGDRRGGGAQARRARPIPRRSSRRCPGLTFTSPFGSVTFRPIDHQSTMGAYVGRTAVKDGKGVMVDWRYADGKDYLPTDDVVREMRPQRQGSVVPRSGPVRRRLVPHRGTSMHVTRA